MIFTQAAPPANEPTDALASAELADDEDESDGIDWYDPDLLE